jgi:hypothetical protein
MAEVYGLGIACPDCGTLESDVKDSRPTLEGGAIRRRRHCIAGHRFTTYELVVTGATVIRPGLGARPPVAMSVDEWTAKIVASLTSGVPELVRRIAR